MRKAAPKGATTTGTSRVRAAAMRIIPKSIRRLFTPREKLVPSELAKSSMGTTPSIEKLPEIKVDRAKLETIPSSKDRTPPVEAPSKNPRPSLSQARSIFADYYANRFSENLKSYPQLTELLKGKQLTSKDMKDINSRMFRYEIDFKTLDSIAAKAKSNTMTNLESITLNKVLYTKEQRLEKFKENYGLQVPKEHLPFLESFYLHFGIGKSSSKPLKEIRDFFTEFKLDSTKVADILKVDQRLKDLTTYYGVDFKNLSLENRFNFFKDLNKMANDKVTRAEWDASALK